MAFTFFFRDQHVLELVVDQLRPHLAGRSHASIWDAGCAMGQEPYTLAIMLAEKMGYFAFNNLRIDATDLDNGGRFGPIVKAAAYPREEIDRMPDGILEKYFEKNGKPNHYQVVERIRSRVAYRQHNLLSLQEAGHGYSLVLCKNVLLHFQPPERVEVLRMFHRALAPEGFFATEQTQKMPEEAAPLFERVAPDGQVFRKVEADACGS